jgi:putative ABC transport system permease protein
MFSDSRANTALKLLWYNRTISSGAITGVIAIVFLVGIQIAILFGVINIINNQIMHTNADAWIVTKNTTNLDFSGRLPNFYMDRAVGLNEVEYARPFINAGGLMRDHTGRYELEIVYGIKMPQLTGGPWAFQRGNSTSMLDPFSFTIDNTTLMNPNPPQFNQIIEVQYQKLKFNAITDFIRSFRGNVSYTSVDNARKFRGENADFVNAIMVKFKEGTDLKGSIEKLAQLYPYATVLSSEDLASQTVKYYLLATGVGGSIFMSAGISALVGLIVIGLTLYNNILSHEHELAILRVLGARKRDILLILVYQVLIIAVIGLFIGFVLLAFTLNFVSQGRIPVALPIWFGPAHILLTIFLCLLGSYFAMRHALKIDPSSAFR